MVAEVPIRTPPSPPSWSNLPLELLYQILSLLEDDLDIFRCSYVCLSWKIVAAEVFLRRRRIPKLLILFNKNFGEDSIYFHNVSALGESQRICLPEFCYTRRQVCNSTNGWLLTVDLKPFEATMKLYLQNPILRTEIPLPQLDVGCYARLASIQPNFFWEVHIRKGITSRSPLEKGCLVLLIHGGGIEPGLAFCRLGDEEWRDLEYSLGVRFVDIVHCKGQFYAADELGRIFLCELNCLHPKVKEVMPAINKGVFVKYSYLVESFSGDLLFVLGKLKMGEEEENPYCGSLYEVSFEVYNIELATKVRSKLMMLGDQALFIGRDGSNSVSTAVGPGASLRSNCIYFLVNVSEGYPCDYHGMNMFDLETNSISRLYKSQLWSSQLHWIIPDM